MMPYFMAMLQITFSFNSICLKTSARKNIKFPDLLTQK